MDYNSIFELELEFRLDYIYLLLFTNLIHIFIEKYT